MNVFLSLKNRKTPMRRKLLRYMLALAAIVLAFLSCGLFFLGHFSTAKQSAANNLNFQMKTFERQILKYFEDLTRMGESLSDNVAKKTEEFLSSHGITIKDLDNDAQKITALQNLLFEKLGSELLKTDCSGAFVMLGATTDTSVIGAEKSRTGLYFKRSSQDEADETLLLYRGIADIGREKGVFPHRKWQLEFDLNEVHDYDEYLKHSSPTEGITPFLTGIALLPGTSERAMHFVVPVFGRDGSQYGFCGFEIASWYFKRHFEQPTQLEHLTCMMFPKNGDSYDTENGFSTGVYGGYYLPPQGVFTVTDIGDGLSALGGESALVANVRQTVICGDEYVLFAAYPKSEYDKEVADNVVSVVLLVLLLLCTTFTVCMVFSRKFLQPLLKGLDQIRKQEHKDAESGLTEIDDLFAFLAEQDRLRDEEAEMLKRQNEDLATVTENQTNEIGKRQAEIERLAYSRKTEIDPEDYEMFKIGLKELTKTEKTVFDLYLQGKTAKEIADILNIRDSTLKFHNHNILEKLGVSSRKQMLRYATLLKQETQNE